MCGEIEINLKMYKVVCFGCVTFKAGSIPPPNYQHFFKERGSFNVIIYEYFPFSVPVKKIIKIGTGTKISL